jgi:hypothetical protein
VADRYGGTHASSTEGTLQWRCEHGVRGSRRGGGGSMSGVAPLLSSWKRSQGWTRPELSCRRRCAPCSGCNSDTATPGVSSPGNLSKKGASSARGGDGARAASFYGAVVQPQMVAALDA